MRMPKVKRHQEMKHKILKIVKMLRILIIALFFFFAGETTFAQSQDSVFNNENFLRESVRIVLKDNFSDFPESRNKLIFLEAEKKHQAFWLLEEELLSFLKELNYDVGLSGNQKFDFSEGFIEKDSWKLSYRVLELKLSYPKLKSTGFLKEKIVIRRAYLNLYFRLTDLSSGKILWTKKMEDKREDEIKKGWIKNLNNETYPFLSPQLPQSNLEKYLEPAMVAFFVGGLVYLFFANR